MSLKEDKNNFILQGYKCYHKDDMLRALTAYEKSSNGTFKLTKAGTKAGTIEGTITKDGITYHGRLF